MPVAPLAQRNFDVQNLEGEIKLLEQEILDNEYVERLASNADWAALGRSYRKAMELRISDGETLKKTLLSEPLTPDQTVQLRETVMLYERDRINTDDFLGYPARMKETLKDLRRELDIRRDALRKLKGEDHG